MGWWMGLGSAVADKIIQWAARRSTLATSSPRLGGSWLAGQAIFPEWSTEKAVKEGYKASYIYYTVASDLAGCIRSVPWVLKRKTKTGSEIVDSHPLVDMLRSPNSETTWGALTEAWDIFKSLDGNGYGHFVQIGDEIKVWHLRNDRVKIIPDARGHIGSYEYTVEGMGKPDKYPPEEILHFKFFDPGSDHLGLAPLQAGAPIIDTLNELVKWNKYSVGNRAIPDMIVGPDGLKVPLSPTQYADWRKQIDEQIKGPKDAHKMLINSFGVKIAEMSRTPAEMDFIKSMEFYEAAACKILHVHPEAIGALSATFKNKEWAIRDKWEGPVESRLSEMRAVQNHKFRPLFGTTDPKVAAPGDLFLDYDLSNTPGANAAQKEALERATKVWACGVPWDVADEKFGVGIGPIPGGDVGYLPVNVLPVGASLTEGRSIRSVNLQTDEQFAAHWRTIDYRKQGWERGVTVKVAQEFRLEREVVVKAIKAGHVDVDYVIDGRVAAWSKLVTAVMRGVIEDFGGQVADDLNAGASEAGAASQKAIAALSGDRLETRQGYVFDPWNDLIQDFVAAKTAKDVQHITDTTKKVIRKAVREGLDANEGSAQIAKRVEEIYSDKWIGEWGYVPAPGECKYRCAVIARTEVHSAAGFGMHESARQSGVVEEKHWYDSGDERVRDSHIAATAQGWVPFDQLFSNGCMYPGDGPSEETILCRCVEAFRTRGR